MDERAALARLVRDEGPRVLATLVRTTGSWELAEDAVQDAVIRALEVWRREGVPPQPRAWLTLTARRRAIDVMRREAARHGKETDSTVLAALRDPDVPEATTVRDDLLRLLFTCCHPSLSVDTRVALALRTLCGLSSAEIARALLVSEATMAKRLSRARTKIIQARIPYRVPDAGELPPRLDAVLSCVYLLFNEGYHATGGASPMRRELCAEAIRLACLLRELLPDDPSVIGLHALLLLQDARAAARLDDAGEPVLLADQDRKRWNREQIRAGLQLLGVGLRRCPGRPNPYLVQAAIAACHDLAPTWSDTNWPAILSWYDVLLRVSDTPVTRLNRAVAYAEVNGPEAALRELDALADMPDYFPLAAARAQLAAAAGDQRRAHCEAQLALSMSGNDAAKQALRRRLTAAAR